MNRRKARELAFICLFEQAVIDEEMREIIQNAKDLREADFDDFSESLAIGASDNREFIDEKIKENIRGWAFNRITKTALAVLRLAVYEMIIDKKTPVSICINEAVEIAKTYGIEKDPAYINGVLSSISKKISGDTQDDESQDGESQSE